MSEEMIIAPPGAVELLTPVMDLAVARQRLRQFQEFVRDYLVEEEDFGTIPGTNKPTLLKPGADKLCEIYGLSDSYSIISKIEDFDKGLFDYTIECSLTNKRYGVLVSQGLGSCNSYEGKYRWRQGQRVCPECGKEAIIKGKEQFGGGWLCWKNKGGCGHKWPDGAKEIEGQNTEKVMNDDIATLKNTILKMAKKRAKIDATLSATRSSGIFTQDVEDFPHGETEPKTTEDTPTPKQEKKAESQVEEKNGLVDLIGAIKEKAGSGEIAMCKVQTEGGNFLLLRMQSSAAKTLEIDQQIKFTGKRLPSDSPIPIYNLMELDTSLKPILDKSLVQAQEKLAQKRSQVTEPEKVAPAPSNEQQVSSQAHISSITDTRLRIAADSTSKIARNSSLTKKQMDRLWAMGHEVWPDKNGVSIYKEEVYNLLGRHGVEHMHDLTPKQYEAVCEELTNLKLEPSAGDLA